MNNPAPVVSQAPPVVSNPPVAVPAGPSINVTRDQQPSFINFTVQNTSTEDLKCVYNAKKTKGIVGPDTTTRDFSLKATTTSNELRFLGIPKEPHTR